MSKTINEMLEGSSSLLAGYLTEEAAKKELQDDTILDLEDSDDCDLIIDYLIKDSYFPKELHYEDMTVCMGVIPGVRTLSNGDPGYPDEVIEGEADWDYSYDADSDDFWHFLEANNFYGIDDLNHARWADLRKILEQHEDAFDEYLHDIYEDRAAEEAWESYDPDDYVDWDSMPGGHDYY